MSIYLSTTEDRAEAEKISSHLSQFTVRTQLTILMCVLNGILYAERRRQTYGFADRMDTVIKALSLLFDEAK